MNIYESKELAEQLSGEKVVIEAIEGIHFGIDELPREISMILDDNEEEYMVYVNPVEGDMVVVHVSAPNEEVLVSFLGDEYGNVKEVYK